MTEYVYVTGCDTGFGNILTKMLDKKGCGVFAGCFMQDSIDTLKKECSDRVIPLQLDVSNEESVNNVAAQIKDILSKKGAKLHGVVNNAGILITPGPVEWTPTESYRRMFDVNVMGTVMVSKSVLPMIRESRGRIVNVASIAGRIGLPSQPAYCISKYGVEAFSDILRTDMLSWGVSVHIVEPGVFSKTGLYDQYQTGLDKLWNNLPENLKKEYGHEFYQFFREMLGKALTDFGNTNSNLVPEAMMDALFAKTPKYRYRVGLDSKYLITVVSKLHESVQDMILTAGDPSTKPVLPAAAPKNGKAALAKRYEGSNYKYYALLVVLFILYRKFRN